MKREGWQHGVVRTTTTGKALVGAGGFVKAPTKPNNHSKYSGKCRKARCSQCHSNPVTKSRDKAKGSYKLKSSDVVLNHRLVSWRVVSANNDRRNVVDWSKYSGISATGILDALLTDSCWSQESDDQDVIAYGTALDDHHHYYQALMPGCEIQEEEDDGDATAAAEEIEESDINGVEEEDDDDELMDFCEVGFVFEYMDDDEDWCVVDEM